MQLLTKATSGAQEVSVYEANQLYGEIGKFRFLQFSDDAIQGAIDLKEPKRIVLEYPRAMIHLMERNNPAFNDVFIIGHGIGTIAGHYPNKRFVVAEIDETVIELSKSYFHYHMDNIRVGDGRQLLGEQEQGSFDYMILDAFTESGTPYHLMTLEFMELAVEKLNDRGMLLMNVTGKLKNDTLIDAVYTTLKETFMYVKAFSLKAEHLADARNIILAGSNCSIAYETMAMAGFYEIGLDEGYVMRDKHEHK
ncbi:spermidine synthase [Paenibacillus sinopodophylli]|uniref:spermidine synthase n=1 Tax=Paenibacillus sinopodophylli TaxID=1837342 RepID=UPI00110CCF40|nr:fused MFS/spermidine synthase [Paenibacillus sinopodophylli]